MTPTIDAVIFDFGNVLITWDPAIPYEGILTPDELAEFFAEIDFASFNHRQDAGRTWAEARAELERTHPHRVDLVDVYFENFAKTLTGTVPGSSELVTELEDLGIQLYGLTNWSAELFAPAPLVAPAITQMRDIVISGEVGLAKPDLAIFELAIAQFGVAPDRTAFFDDVARNVESGHKAGLHSRQFTTVAQCRLDLRALGVPVTLGPTL